MQRNTHNQLKGRLGLAALAGLMIAVFGESQAASLSDLGQQTLATGAPYVGSLPFRVVSDLGDRE